MILGIALVAPIAAKNALNDIKELQCAQFSLHLEFLVNVIVPINVMDREI